MPDHDEKEHAMIEKTNKPRPSRRDMDKARERKFYGRAACLALFELRRKDVIRVYVTEALVKEFSHVLKWCAQNKKAYHILTDANLEKVAETGHHEGVCFIATERPFLSLLDLFDIAQQQKNPMCLLMLDGVSNPHNLGAIFRSAAHLGVSYIIATETSVPSVAGALARVAEGAAEHVQVVRCGDLTTAMGPLRKLGFSFAATHVSTGKSLFKSTIAPRTVLCMGSESSGLSKAIIDKADICLNIPGTGRVESLNVATATALLMCEYARQNQTLTDSGS